MSYYIKLVLMFLFPLFLLQSCEKGQNTLDNDNDDDNDDDINNNIVKDVEGNEYETIVIGNQTWMKENLKTKHYNDAAPITTDTGLTHLEYAEAREGIYSVYDNNSANAEVYGLLYNWYVVADLRKICPQGWHVPSDEEWTELTEYLDGANVAGGKMKSLSLWDAPNTDATNSSGFSGLPAGVKTSQGHNLINKQGSWWSSTENTTHSAWFRFLSHSDGRTMRGPTIKYYGVSIRCIKD